MTAAGKWGKHRVAATGFLGGHAARPFVGKERVTEGPAGKRPVSLTSQAESFAARA